MARFYRENLTYVEWALWNTYSVSFRCNVHAIDSLWSKSVLVDLSCTSPDPPLLSSKRHQFLKIPEVFGLIFDALGNEERRDACCPSLAGLASVCKTFHYTAIEAFWREILSISLVAHLFPPGTVSQRGSHLVRQRLVPNTVNQTKSRRVFHGHQRQHDVGN
jgi:hypothetical protein